MDYEDFDDDIELEGNADEWDEDALGLEWDEADAQSVVRDLGITSATSA
jgi:hypothetical protein